MAKRARRSPPRKSARRTKANARRGAKARPTKKPRHWFWRSIVLLFKVGLVVGVLASIPIGFYLVSLDRQITATFEGRRWSLPARVFAAPLELYAGASIDIDDFILELLRVGYQRGDPATPGRFRDSDDAVEVTLRPFVFPDGPRRATTISVRFRHRQVDRIDGRSTSIASIRLEPPVVGSFFASHGEDRIVVSPAETPTLLIETLKAVEDRNFDSHPGFDLRGIARAAWQNLLAGEITQGGSTLTQQLVTSYYLTRAQTLARKLREVAMAVILEWRYSKTELMNAYINEIHLGQHGVRAIHGFGLGSLFYFNKPLAELDAHEIALLVTVIRGTSYYNPYRNPERALARRDRILATMQEFALIDAATFERAVESDLGVVTSRRGGRYYPAFMDLVRQQLRRDYDKETLAEEGLRIFTTLDPRRQDLAQLAATVSLKALEAERKIEPDTLQVAVVIRASQTGDVLAIVGGRDAGAQGFNRALNARRQVGSLIKPLVYLEALESERYHLASMVLDEPLTLSDFDDWSPRNFDEEFRGPVPLIRALGDSLNVPTVRLGMDVGIDAIADRVEELTDRDPVRYPALVLGAVELTPLEVSNIYAVFAGGGFLPNVNTVTDVLDSQARERTRYELQVHQVTDYAPIEALNTGLQAAMARGTGRRSPHAKSGIAGKTGTTTGNRDSWFAGYDGDLLTVVWIGRDDNSPHGLSGSVGALRVWDRIMRDIDAAPLTMDDRLRTIDYRSGRSIPSHCPDAVRVALPESVALTRTNCSR